MKIAVVTYYAVTNIGDRILTDTLCWMLSSHQTQIVDINGRYPYKFTRGGYLSQIEKFLVKCFVKRKSDYEINRYFRRVLKGKDLIIFGGGQIADFIYTDCCRRIYDIVNIAEEYHIPVAYNAIGFAGEDCKSANAQMFIKSLNSKTVIDISVREKFEFASNILLQRKHLPISLVADTAVWSSECYGIVKMRKTNTIGINVIRDSIINEYNKLQNINIVDIYCKLYLEFKSLGYNVRFFTNGVDKDNETISNIKEKLGLKEECISNFTKGKGKSFLKMLCDFDFVVSSRLHTSICCYSLKIPTIALAWDDKFKEFYKNSNQYEHYINDYNNIDNIIELCRSIIEKGYEYKDYIQYRTTIKQHIQEFLSRINASV